MQGGTDESIIMNNPDTVLFESKQVTHMSYHDCGCDESQVDLDLFTKIFHRNVDAFVDSGMIGTIRKLVW